MHLKIYTGTLKKRPIFTVYWRVGEKPFRKLFADPIKAEDFAKAQAEQLAAGQVHAPAISITEAQTFREAQLVIGLATIYFLTRYFMRQIAELQQEIAAMHTEFETHLRTANADMVAALTIDECAIP